jgi:hypothetical protein
MQTEQERRKLVTWAIHMTEGTHLQPGHYERHLLEQYVSGAFSIEEVIDLLAEQPTEEAVSSVARQESLGSPSAPTSRYV